MPVDIITSEEIVGGNLLTDALALKPGVFVQQTTPGQGAPIVRGLKGSEVLHLVDGMRLNNAIFRNAPTQYFSLISPGTLERIEVVRGASTSLYGSDAVGGVVRHWLHSIPPTYHGHFEHLSILEMKTSPHYSVVNIMQVAIGRLAAAREPGRPAIPQRGPVPHLP